MEARYLLLLLLLLTVADAFRTPDRELPDEKRAKIGSSRGKHKRRGGRPNVVLLLTDDQDVELGSMNFMPKTLRIMQEGGANLHNAFVTTPMCCPSRSSMLTGMYVHNHNTYTNNDNCSSVQWQQTYETRNFGTYLSNAGYRTGYFGKYLNEYQGTYIPPGWSEWVGLIRNSRFYNYSINFNGKKIRHSDNYYRDYLTDLIANDSVTFLKQSKQYFPNRPVGMVLSFPAPHGPEDSAPQYQHMFPNVTTHRTPSWNFAPNPDKQWILQHTGKMEPIHIAFTDQLQRKRLQTLQSVDDAVEKVYQELKELGELDNTYIIYTADHGYHLGQYGLLKGKAMPYDFDIRVPFYIRGPKIPRGIRVPNIALNIDLAPTMLDIAGLETPEHMDGRSLLRIFEGADEPGSIIDGTLRRKKAWRDTFLVERGKLTKQKLTLREKLESRKNNLIMSKEQRLRSECEKSEYQAPCSANQQWECKSDKKSGKLRIYKCRHGRQSDRSETGGPNSELEVNRRACHCPKPSIEDIRMNRGEKKRQRAFLKKVVNQPQRLRPKFLHARRNPRIQSESFNFDEERAQNDGLTRRARRRFRRLPHTGKTKPFVPDPRFRHKRSARGESCKVLANNTIVCSDSVYQNFDSWKDQKNYLDHMIQQSKERLERFKEMRKHLKLTRPQVETPVINDPFGNSHGPSQNLEDNESENISSTVPDSVPDESHISLNINISVVNTHTDEEGIEDNGQIEIVEDTVGSEEEDEENFEEQNGELSQTMTEAILNEGYYDPECSCPTVQDRPRNERQIRKMQNRNERIERKKERKRKKKKVPTATLR